MHWDAKREGQEEGDRPEEEELLIVYSEHIRYQSQSLFAIIDVVVVVVIIIVIYIFAVIRAFMNKWDLV